MTTNEPRIHSQHTRRPTPLNLIICHITISSNPTTSITNFSLVANWVNFNERIGTKPYGKKILMHLHHRQRLLFRKQCILLVPLNKLENWTEYANENNFPDVLRSVLWIEMTHFWISSKSQAVIPCTFEILLLWVWYYAAPCQSKQNTAKATLLGASQ